jgi:uncharacterized integral membrane protein
MRLLRRLLLAALVIALLYVGWRFPTENAQAVRVHYLVGSFEEVPLWLALGASFLLGAALAGLVAALKLTRARLETRRYRKAARGLESEVHQLRNLPLSAEGPAAGAGEPDLASGLPRGP